jgi:hypothetical protein
LNPVVIAAEKNSYKNYPFPHKYKSDVYNALQKSGITEQRCDNELLFFDI